MNYLLLRLAVMANLSSGMQRYRQLRIALATPKSLF